MRAKEVIIRVAKEEQEKAIVKLNEQLKELENEERLPILCLALAKIFHNNQYQKQVQIDLLNERLTNSFFKGAEVRATPNLIVFSNKDFSVSFPTTSEKAVFVTYLNGTSMPSSSSNSAYIERNEKGAELLSAYLDKKSLKNLKAFVAWNSSDKYTTNIIGITYKYYQNLKYHCNAKTLERIRQGVAEAKEFDRQNVEKMKLFDEEQVMANEFLESLTDLKQFEESGWKIICKRFMHNGRLEY